MAIKYYSGINISGSIVPSADSTFNLGGPAFYFSNVYADTYYGDGSNLTGLVVDEATTANTALALTVTVKNISGGSLSKGTVVHAAPSTVNPPSGNVIEVIAADYDTAADMPGLGVLNETLADDAEGEAIMFGAVSGIDTSSFIVGSELYVGNNGALTGTKPTGATQLIQKIAVVIKSSQNNGLIKVFGAGRTNDVPNLNVTNASISGGVLTLDRANATDIVYSPTLQDITDNDATTNRTIQAGGLKTDLIQSSSQASESFIDLDDDNFVNGATNVLNISSKSHMVFVTDTNSNGTDENFGFYTQGSTDQNATKLFEVKQDGNIDVTSGAVQVGGTTVIDSSRNLDNIGTISSGDITISKQTAFINMGYQGGPHGINFYDDSGGNNDLRWGFYYRTSPDTITFETGGTSAKFTLDTSGNLDITGDLSAVGGTFSSNVNITKNNVGIATNYGSSKIEATDAQLDLVSSSSGTWGSAINLVEGASTTANTDLWSIARHTTGGSGDSGLYFNFGTSNQHDNTNRVKFSSSGDITGNSFIKSGGTSSQFLKADGSVDSNTYLTGSHTHDDRYYTETESDDKFAPVKRGSVTISKDSYTRVARVEGNNLASTIRMTVHGTTGSIVVNCLSDISVNHSADIIVHSQAGNYSSLDIKIISNNNEDFDIYLQYTGSSSAGTSFTAAIEIFPLNNETITYSPTATAYSGTTFIHTATPGQIKWGQSGQTPNIYLGSNKVYHAGNDGPGSGLDADTVDGIQASQFLRSDANDSTTGQLTVESGIIRTRNDSGNIASIRFAEDTANDHVILEYDGTGSGATNYFHMYSNVSGWATKGSSFNMQPSTGNINIGGTNFGYNFRVDGTSYLGKTTIQGTANGNDPTLRITSTTSNTFNHAIEAFNSNLTTGEHNIVLFGKEGNTKNSGYIGYYWSAAASNNNFVTIGHWGADDLFRVYPDQITGNSSFRAPIFYDINNTGYYFHGDATTNLNALTVNGTFTVVNGVINMNNNDGFVYDDAANVMKVKYDGTTYNIWTQANDGSGSGLDADLLDGQHASAFASASHNHDDRYYTESEIQQFFDRGYLNSHGASNLAVGWYTIATNTGDRALGEFQIWDTASSDHQSVLFNASHHFGVDSSNDITVLANSRYSGTNFRYIRIKDGGTYDGAALQVYIDGSSNSVYAAIVGGNAQSSGWVLKDWIPDATDPGDLSNYSSFGVRCQVDLDLVINGGIITTGQIYAGGETTQYKVWNQGNDGSGSGLDADLLDGVQGSSFLRSDADDTVSAGVTYTWNSTDTHGLQFTNASYGTSLYVGGWSTSNSTNISRLRTSSGNFHLDSASNGNIYLNHYSGGIAYIGNGGGHTYMYNSARSPIFYDSDNTAYYLNAASTSRINRIDYTELHNTSSSNNGRFLNHSSWGTLHQTDSGYIQFGPANTSFAHIYTDRGSFYFNKTIYVNGGSEINTGDIRSAIFYDKDNTARYLNPAGDSILSHIRLHNHCSLESSHGRGFRFWNSNSYKIHMSASSQATHGGRVAGETTSDYNMYFTMSGGTNRGFVFKNANSSSGGNCVAGIDASGNGRFIGDVIAYSSSDKRLKDNITLIDNPIDKVQKISGVTFDWNDKQDTYEHGKHDVGVIAQEIEEVLPEVVDTRENGYKAVKYEKIVPLLIEAIKEQQKQIDELKKLINP